MPGLSGLSNQSDERNFRFPLSAPFGPFDDPPWLFIFSVLLPSRRSAKRATWIRNMMPIHNQINETLRRASSGASAMLEAAANAPVAQLDRVSVFETEGWRFEPFRARQNKLKPA